MGMPKRDDKGISRLPIEAFLTYKTLLAATKSMVNNGAGMPMRFCLVSWSEETQSALYRRHGGTLVFGFRYSKR